MTIVYKTFKLSSFIFFFIICTFFSTKSTAQYSNFVSADSINPIFHATPVPQNINGFQFVDIDGDGDLDWYVRSDTSMLLYRNEGSSKNPKYVLSATSGFENTGITAFSDVFAFADLDGDGDPDFVMQQILYPSIGLSRAIISYYENTGTKQNPVFTKSSNNPISSYVNIVDAEVFAQIGFPDVNGDGKPDLYFTYPSGSDFYTNIYLNISSDTTPSYSYYTQLIASPNLNHFFFSFYDFNGDGLPDIENNDGYINTTYEQNGGTISAPVWIPPIFLYPGPTFPIAPYVITDLNGDGIPEVFNIHGNYAVCSSTVLPLQWLSVEAERNNNITNIKWATANEVNSKTYQVQKSKDGIMWQNIGTAVGAAKGVAKNDYSITDVAVLNGTVEYRIVETDVNGKTSYSSIVSVTNKAENTVTVYPMPAHSMVNVKANSGTTIKRVKVYDANGKLVIIKQESNSNFYNFSISGLANGYYKMQIETNDGKVARSFVKN